MQVLQAWTLFTVKKVFIVIVQKQSIHLVHPDTHLRSVIKISKIKHSSFSLLAVTVLPLEMIGFFFFFFTFLITLKYVAQDRSFCVWKLNYAKRLVLCEHWRVQNRDSTKQVDKRRHGTS